MRPRVPVRAALPVLPRSRGLNVVGARDTLTAVDPNAAVVEALVRRHRDELVAFVRRRAGHLVDPDDVVQHASVRAIAKADRLRDPARGRAWLFRITRNQLADELRRLQVPTVPPVDDGSVEALRDEMPLAEGHACRCAIALTDALKPEYAAVLRRVVLDETPMSALADELGVTTNNLTVRLHRARKALRERLAEHCRTETLRACLSCVCDERGCCALDA
jgi:RNA polymerase sigma factor (sigma-70 family)